MESYRFEEMREKHLAEVFAIYNYYVLHTTATFNLQALTPEEMREIVFFADEKYKTFVIFAGKIICGYVAMSQHSRRKAYDITAQLAVYLHRDYVGRGAGSAAIKYIEEYAKQQGIHVLIGTICEQNKKSIRLMEKNGYTKCAHYKEIGQKFGKLLDIVAYQKVFTANLE